MLSFAEGARGIQSRTVTQRAGTLSALSRPRLTAPSATAGRVRSAVRVYDENSATSRPRPLQPRASHAPLRSAVGLNGTLSKTAKIYSEAELQQKVRRNIASPKDGPSISLTLVARRTQGEECRSRAARDCSGKRDRRATAAPARSGGTTVA